MFKKIIYLFLIFIILLLIIDFVTGSIYSEIKNKEKSSVEFWKKSVTLNSLGFRDLEHHLKKKKGIFRLVVLGDSQTYGQLIQEEEKIYPRRLESLLNQGLKEPRFEVINFSKPGWGTGDEFSALLDHGLKYEPDLIFVGYWSNDIPILSDTPLEFCRSSLDFFLQTKLKSVYNLLRKSSIFNFSLNCVSLVGCTLSYGASYAKCLNNLSKTRGWELQKIYFDLLDFAARRENVHSIIGILPFISASLGDEYPLLKGNKIIKAFLKVRGIQFIDLYESGFKGRNPLKLSEKKIRLRSGVMAVINLPEIHFNSSAADLVARIVYDKLKVIKDRFDDEKFALNYSKDQVVGLLRQTLDSTKGKGNPLLQFKTPNFSLPNPIFDNRLFFADPLFFERSWIPYLHKKTGPKEEQAIYKALTFFYLWKDYFDSLVSAVLNDKHSMTFVRALKKVY